MKVKRNINSGILLIIAIILTTTDCAVKKGGPGRFTNAKNSIMSFLTMSPNTFKKWNTSSYGISFNKAIGIAPIAKQNEVKDLLKLIADEADLIKIGAFRKLNKLSNNPENEEAKKKLILAKLQGTVELIKFYGVVWNCPRVKFTLAQGMYYVYSCVKIFGEDKKGECLKKKIQLYTAFMFSHKIEMNRFVRFFLNRKKKEAEKLLPGDRTIKFLDTKVACEIKFAQDSKNFLLRSAMKIYMGSSNKEKTYNCINELLAFEKEITDVDSYVGEYHLLLAKAYGQQKYFKLALDQLDKARAAPVVDAKTRDTNKKVQAYYEKMYIANANSPTSN